MDEPGTVVAHHGRRSHQRRRPPPFDGRLAHLIFIYYSGLFIYFLFIVFLISAESYSEYLIEVTSDPAKAYSQSIRLHVATTRSEDDVLVARSGCAGGGDHLAGYAPRTDAIGPPRGRSWLDR